MFVIFVFNLLFPKLFTNFILESTTVPHWAVLASFSLKVTGMDKARGRRNQLFAQYKGTLTSHTMMASSFWWFSGNTPVTKQLHITTPLNL